MAATAASQASDAVWTMRGDTTMRAERYEERGDAALSPHLHTGTHAYQDFNVHVSGRPRASEYWELNLSAVASGSDYRTQEDGLTPEWLHLRHENSSAAMPFRLDVGDQLARFSRLTLDRTLQAGRVELQPHGPEQRRQSLVLISGRDRTHWHQPVGTDDQYHGASWLIDDKRLGRYSVNVVQTRSDGVDPQSPEDTQLLASVAAAWEMAAFSQQLAAEAEWAWQDQQRRESQSDTDRGLRLHVSGTDAHLPMEYQLRFERYGEDFEPGGVDRGVLAKRLADTRSMGAAGGWRFRRGMELRGRYDRFVTDASSRMLTVDDWAVQLLSPATFGWVPLLGHEWALRFRDRGNARGSIDTSSTEARWTISLAGRQDVSATRVQLRWFEQDDYASGLFAIEERQVVVTHARQFHVGGVDLIATPGMDFRDRTGFGEVTLLSPTLSLNLDGQSHHLGLHLGYRAFDHADRQGMDLEEYSVKLGYRYQFNTHTLGLDYDHLLREPDVGEELEAWRAGVFWRYGFDYTL